MRDHQPERTPLMDAPNRILEQSANSVFETREAYLMEHRSFPDSNGSQTMRIAFLSIREERSPVVPHARPFESLAGQHRCSAAF